MRRCSTHEAAADLPANACTAAPATSASARRGPRARAPAPAATSACARRAVEPHAPGPPALPHVAPRHSCAGERAATRSSASRRVIRAGPTRDSGPGARRTFLRFRHAESDAESSPFATAYVNGEIPAQRLHQQLTGNLHPPRYRRAPNRRRDLRRVASGARCGQSVFPGHPHAKAARSSRTPCAGAAPYRSRATRARRSV
jgi:hypothetical protein